MDHFSVAEAKTHLSRILEQVEAGEEVVLTKRGQPVARIVAIERTTSILGAGQQDPNMNQKALDADVWWQSLTDEQTREWYE